MNKDEAKPAPANGHTNTAHHRAQRAAAEQLAKKVMKLFAPPKEWKP